MEHDVLTLSDFYSDRGYAFVNVDPRTQVDPGASGKRHLRDHPGPRSPDRPHQDFRQYQDLGQGDSPRAQVQEQEPYSATKIQVSKARLDALGISRPPIDLAGARDGQINLDVKVQEGNTGSFQAARIRQLLLAVRHLPAAKHQPLRWRTVGSFSARSAFCSKLSVSYTEPWFLDMPLAVSLQGFDNQLYLFSFNQSEIGFLLNSGYPLADLALRKLGPFSLEHITAGLGYQFESVGISNLSPFTTFDIQNSKGTSRVSESLPSIRRFTVDDARDPRSGSVESLDLELAGLGGTPFLKGVLHGHWFFRSSRVRGLANGFTRPRSRSAMVPRWKPAMAATCRCSSAFSPGGLNGQGQVRGYEIYSLGPQVTLFNQFGNRSEWNRWRQRKELLFSQQIGFPISTRSDCAATCSSMRVIRSWPA